MSTVLTQRSRAARATAAIVVCCLLATACGSNLEPSQVDRAGGSADGGAAVDTDGDGVVDPGTGGEPAGAADLPGDAPPGSPGDVPAGDAPGDGGADAPAEAPDGAPDDAAPPAGNGPQGSCDGFKNQTGVTDSEITIANASDISGPVPNLFLSARQATQAFVAYFNQTSDLCGRKLRVLELDSRADAGADQQAYTEACGQAFAAVGSMSSFDQGGARTAQECGLPDIRSFGVSPERQACTTCVAAYTTRATQIADSLPKFWLKEEPDASQHVGIFYVNVAAAKVNAENFGKAYEKAGMNVDVSQGIETSEFNYVPYVQQMKDNDIDFVQYFGPYQFAQRLLDAMKQQSYHPAVFLEDPTIYDANFVKNSNGSAEGAYVDTPNGLFDDVRIPEMRLYRAYLEQVAPGATPNYYGLFAWSAARLFVEQATALGGRLTRPALVDAMRKVKKWDGNGLHAPMDVGGGTTSPCIAVIRLTGTTWRQVSPGKYLCGGLINV